MYKFLSQLTISDRIQLSMSFFTLFAALVALFYERFWRWMDKPRIEVSFDPMSDRCFRYANVKPDKIQDEGEFLDVKRQYFSLKVANTGGHAKRLKLKVDILDENQREVKRFQPTTIRWISNPPTLTNRIIKPETIDLARGEAEYVNLISQVLNYKNGIKNRLRVEVFDTTPRGIAWDRPLSIYNYKIIIYGDNISPKVHKAKFTPDKDVEKPGNLELDC